MSDRGIGYKFGDNKFEEAVGVFYFLLKAAVSKDLSISNVHKIL